MSDANSSQYPNGQLVVPNWVGPAVSALGAMALAATQIFPPHTIAYKIGTALVGLAGIFGPLSGGLRK